jgi:predicted Zn-dependent protease
MKPTRLEQLQQLINAEPGDDFLLFALAMEYLSLNNKVLALEHFESLRLKSPDYLPLYYQLATLLNELSKKDQATGILEAGIELAKRLKQNKTQMELQNLLSMIAFDD